MRTMRFRSTVALLAFLLACLWVTPQYAVRAADTSGTPARCAEDGHTYYAEAGETTRGTISQLSGASCTDGTTASLSIVAQPLAPALVFPFGGWTYFFGAHLAEPVQTTRSFTANAMCGSTIMCQAVISFLIAPPEPSSSSLPSVPPSSSTAAVSSTSTSTPPVSSTTVVPTRPPACTAEKVTMTYRPGVVYSGEFPMDHWDAACVYSARVAQQPPVGILAIMVPASPMKYVFSAPGETPDTTVTIHYSVLCNDSSAFSAVCEDSFDIVIHEEAVGCANAEQPYYVQPGGQLVSTLDLGTACTDTGAEFVVKVLNLQGGGNLTCRDATGLAFTFDAPATEALTTATVRAYCDGEPLCETKVAILTTTQAPPSSSTSLPPVTSTVAPPPPQKTACNRTFSYSVPSGQSLRGTIHYPSGEDCAITTYNRPHNASTPAGVVDVNIVGDFYYKAPAAQVVDVISVDVSCVTTFVCRTQLYFTSYQPLPDDSTTLVPPPTTPPLPACANVYHYQTAPGIPLSSSLNGKPGQDACAYGRYFTLSAPPQSGSLDFMISGDFLYIPTRQEGTDEFAFTQFCLNEAYCSGTAYFIVSNRWTLPPSTTTPTSSKPPVVITNPQITCSGSCVDKAWRTFPNRPLWDDSEGAGYAREDGHPVDGIQVTWGGNSLIFTVYGLIGILGVRFPTFEPLTSAAHTYFEPSNFKNMVAPTSPGFEMSCLAKQDRFGMGEDVWRWATDGFLTGNGTVGAYYDYGESWYQKFGGKHQNCDVFADPCQYAPLLTPANGSAENGLWTINVSNCDTTWTGTFPYASLTKLTRADGNPVWSFIADRSIRGTLISEVVRPHSWISPGRFDARYTTHDIIINLDQFVVVNKIASVDVSPISVDAEFYTYVDESGDEAFGINMLVYPSVTANMTSSYAVDRHVKGFKWLQQSWAAPSGEQCPTCTGNKLTCSAEGQYTTATFTGEFPPGNCPPGIGRIELTKGPQMTLADCSAHPMFVFNRSGFSATRDCKTAYQNITFRGVARGSRALTAAQKHAFNFEGNLTLELLMDDDTRKTIGLDLSMYVSRLSQDTDTASGGLAVCRSGNYWPILDPLGTSVPDAPFEFAVADPQPLCVDDLSTSYGPSDWALFTLNLPHTKPSQVTVRDIHVTYNGNSVYLLYRNPTTGTAAIPPPHLGSWWQHTQPFLAFRDLSARAYNDTITVSDAMANSYVNENAAYAFTFVPGAIDRDANVEVVVNAIIARENGTSTTTFRRMLHVDPVLTQLSRQGPTVVPSKETEDNSKSDLYAIGATTGVAVAVVVVAIFFMVADNSRPLPKWVPRGKLVKDTVLSVLPAGLRKKKKDKKEKRVAHRDMYDAMNSGKY